MLPKNHARACRARSYRFASGTVGFVPDGELTGWRWRVRSIDQNGSYGPWPQTRCFSVLILKREAPDLSVTVVAPLLIPHGGFDESNQSISENTIHRHIVFLDYGVDFL